MTYLEAVSLMKEIESRYDLMQIKYKGVSVWPLLRINIVDAISGNNETMKSTGGSAIKQVLSTLFYYNPFDYFKKRSVWLFAGFERRKEVNGLKKLRVSGCVIDACENTLVIETPGKDQSTTPRSMVPEKDVVSESWLLLFVHAYAILTKWKKIKIENECVLQRVLKEYKIQFDYIGALRVLDAQKKVFDVLLAVIHKPGKVIIECPYTIMGYVWSLHKKAIPVIELQHGVLNDKHYAYNSLYTSPILYPDEICVFGEDEYQFLTGDDSHYCKKVYKTGLYFMELAQKSFTNDIFREYRVKYEHIILVAGQRGYEEAMADYIREAAKKTPKCLYVYVPRDIDAELVFDQENVIYRPGINIYEYMIWCDVHLTISSTTCLECQYYKKPTIFYNYAEMSENYYGKVLKAENGVVFTKSVSEYEQALEKVLTTKFDYKEVFTGNTVKRIKEIINK